MSHSSEDDEGPLEGSVFWIAGDIDGAERKRLIKIVKMQGGVVEDHPSSKATILLYKTDKNVDTSLVGIPVRSTWIFESMDKGELLEIEDYHIATVKRKRKRKASASVAPTSSSTLASTTAFSPPEGDLLASLDEYILAHLRAGTPDDDVWRALPDALPDFPPPVEPLRSWYVTNRLPTLPPPTPTTPSRRRPLTVRPKALPTPQSNPNPNPNSDSNSNPNPTPNPNPFTSPNPNQLRNPSPFLNPSPFSNPIPNPTSPYASSHSTAPPVTVTSLNSSVRPSRRDGAEELLAAMARVTGKPLPVVVFAMMAATGRVGVALDALGGGNAGQMWYARDDEGLLTEDEGERKVLYEELVQRFGYPACDARVQFLEQ